MKGHIVKLFQVMLGKLILLENAKFPIKTGQKDIQTFSSLIQPFSQRSVPNLCRTKSRLTRQDEDKANCGNSAISCEFFCVVSTLVFLRPQNLQHTPILFAPPGALYALMVCYTKFVRFSFSPSPVFPSHSYYLCCIFCNSAHCTVLLARYCNMHIAILHIVDLFQ